MRESPSKGLTNLSGSFKKLFSSRKFVATIKVEKKKKDRSAGALGLGSSSQGKKQAAKGPVPGESLHQDHASRAL